MWLKEPLTQRQVMHLHFQVSIHQAMCSAVKIILILYSIVALCFILECGNDYATG